MSDLKIFENHEFGQVRMVEINGKPFAVGSDIAKALEYAIPHKAVRDHCKGVLTWNVPHPQSADKLQEVLVIPEGDIYRLITKAADQSKNPVIKAKAERFENWLFDEVLPSIRANGSYSLTKQIPQTLPEALRAYADEVEKNEVLKLQTAQQQQIIHELQPKATYYDLCLQNKTLLSVTKIAKDYGMSGNALNNLLHELGVQYKQGDVWLLYQKHADKGYTQSKTHVIDSERSAFHTYWTQSGRLFIYSLLKQEKGILPLIEREAGLKLVGTWV